MEFIRFKLELVQSLFQYARLNRFPISLTTLAPLKIKGKTNHLDLPNKKFNLGEPEGIVPLPFDDNTPHESYALVFDPILIQLNKDNKLLIKGVFRQKYFRYCAKEHLEQLSDVCKFEFLLEQDDLQLWWLLGGRAHLFFNPNAVGTILDFVTNEKLPLTSSFYNFYSVNLPITNKFSLIDNNKLADHSQPVIFHLAHGLSLAYFTRMMEIDDQYLIEEAINQDLELLIKGFNKARGDKSPLEYLQEKITSYYGKDIPLDLYSDDFFKIYPKSWVESYYDDSSIKFKENLKQNSDHNLIQASDLDISKSPYNYFNYVRETLINARNYANDKDFRIHIELDRTHKHLYDIPEFLESTPRVLMSIGKNATADFEILEDQITFRFSKEGHAFDARINLMAIKQIIFPDFFDQFRINFETQIAEFSDLPKKVVSNYDRELITKKRSLLILNNILNEHSDIPEYFLFLPFINYMFKLDNQEKESLLESSSTQDREKVLSVIDLRVKEIENLVNADIDIDISSKKLSTLAANLILLSTLSILTASRESISDYKYRCNDIFNNLNKARIRITTVDLDQLTEMNNELCKLIAEQIEYYNNLSSINKEYKIKFDGKQQTYTFGEQGWNINPLAINPDMLTQSGQMKEPNLIGFNTKK